MYRSLVISLVSWPLICARSMRDEDQFVLPGDMMPSLALMPQIRLPDPIFSPQWGMPQFDMFPMQANALWNSLMSSFDQMMAESMLSIPEISVSDDCVIAVRLSRDTNVNDTDIKVYTSETDIELHITTVRIREWHTDTVDSILDVPSANPALVGSTNGSTAEQTGAANFLPLDSVEEHSSSHVEMAEQSKAAPKLRGFGEMSSSTTIRKIPAPAQCDVFNEEAKATLDTHSNSLLIKFPVKDKVGGSIAEGSGEGKDLLAQKNLISNSENLAEMMDKSPEKKSWWSGMFEQRKEKKTVPIVDRQEF